MQKDQKIHLIGNAHIDPVWMWRWQEGYAEIKATFQSALDRMEEYPDFIFVSACAGYYEWVEENAPEMFSKIQQRVREGRWKIVGGMWIQPDCNVPSGESFARHFLYSQNYFLEKFGHRAVTGYNVDSFGHTGSLPKIFAGAGIQNYVMMRPDKRENPDAPGSLFWWVSDDGSRVLTYRIPNGYGTGTARTGLTFEDQPDIIKLRDTQKVASDAGHACMHFYGVGNHGGGPTKVSIELYREARTLPGGEFICDSDPDTYFSEVREMRTHPEWRKELQHHASLCYSACSEIKHNNRLAENRLTAAETYSVMANALTGYTPETDKLDTAWKGVLFNQFHDIMGGCSVSEAYNDARELHGQSLALAAHAANASVQSISWAIDTSDGQPFFRSKENDWSFWESGGRGTPVVVFNPLAWEREIPVQIGRPVKGLTDSDGKAVSVQKIRASRSNAEDKWDSLFTANVPAMGWKTYWVYLNEDKPVGKSSHLQTGDHYIENDFLRLEIDQKTGAIRSLFNKKANQEVFAGKAAVPLVIDVEHADTWGHALFSFRDVIGHFENGEVQLIESGPVRARLRVKSSYKLSTLQQDFLLYEDAKQIEVQVKLDWREQYKLLKLSFPVDADNETASYGIPFGHICRPANGTEESGQMWFDVTGKTNNHGLAILNDSKYAFDVLDNEMRMTIANGSAYADHFSGEFRDDLMEFLDQGIQKFRYVLLPHSENAETAGQKITGGKTSLGCISNVMKAAISLNTEETHITETYHKGELPLNFEGIRVTPDSGVNCDHVIISAFKPAMDGKGYILRVCETGGMQAKASFEIPVLKRSITVDLPPYSVKSYRIPEVKTETITECDLTEHPV